MKLECTKQLLGYLGVNLCKTVTEDVIDPLFSWTANLITVNRRKTIVAVNQASKCLFVLYGVKTKHKPKIPDLILEGIRALLQSEYVKPDIIEKYLDDCGRTVEYAANSSRSVAAMCSKGCGRVKKLSDCITQDDMFQRCLLPWMNDDISAKENYMFIYECLISKLEHRYGGSVQACRALELEVSLKLETPCKRTMVIPDNLNFYQFNRILQGAFEWRDYHLHEFVLERDSLGRPKKIVRLDDEDQNEFDELLHVTRLDSINTEVSAVLETYGTIEYEYDFGDGWEHTITLKRVIDDCDQPYPHCTEAIGDAPMEDCGGPSGFARIMRMMHTPDDPEYDDICTWVSRTCWEPVNLKWINNRIIGSHRICIPVYYE